MWHNTMKRLAKRMASCHVGHTGTHLITKVKQQWARIVLGWDDKYDGVPASRGLGRLREDRERSYSAWVCEIYKHSSRKCVFLKIISAIRELWLQQTRFLNSCHLEFARLNKAASNLPLPQTSFSPICRVDIWVHYKRDPLINHKVSDLALPNIN
jgi:hypothetical protein